MEMANVYLGFVTAFLDFMVQTVRKRHVQFCAVVMDSTLKAPAYATVAGKELSVMCQVVSV